MWCGGNRGIHAIVSRRAWGARYKLQSVEPALGFVGGVDQVTQGVAKLQKESVGWCVGERGHRGNWVLYNWVMLKVVNESGDSVDHPVEQE